VQVYYPLAMAGSTRGEVPSRLGKQGVAFIINVTDLAVAHEMLERLPFG
jgi:hypothetical protein